MDIVLRDLKCTECCVYLDNIIFYFDTIEEHAQSLGHVLQRFEKANLRLQSAKCVFAKTQVQYLGYIVSREGISASPDNVEAVTKFPVPKNVKKV
jgi:nucleoside diphosphate kinase